MVRATEAFSRFVGTCRELNPLPPPSFFAFWGVPEWNTQCVPGRLFVAGNTCPFFLLLFHSLSLSLSLFLSSLHLPTSVGVPGCFRHSWEPFLFGVSLDACVVAGSTFASSFVSFSFLPPPPSFLGRGVSTSKLGFCDRFLNEVWPVIGLSPLIWFPCHRPPQTSSLLFFHVFLSSCLFTLILSFSCAHYRPDLSLYTYTHAYSTYEFQVAQVCYNEVWLNGCPSSLGSSSSATARAFCLSRLFHFHLSSLRAHVPRITPFPGRMGVPPFRAGWRPHASLRGGVRV